MPTLHSEEFSPYSPHQLFDLVADVTRYPEFLPWCKAARILTRREDGFDAELVIRFMHMTERYTSRVQLLPPTTENEEGAIEVSLIKGPFNDLRNHWHFTPQSSGGTLIGLNLEFRFKSSLLESMIGGVFEKATLKMTEAFKERAIKIYG